MKRPLIALSAFLLFWVCLWAWATQPLLLTPAKEDNPSLSRPDILEHHVRVMAEQLPPRSSIPKDLLKSADYIVQELEKNQITAERQIFLERGVEYQNIVAHFPGDGSGKSKIVIGAHYDVADQLPGADDNASGVAGLLELARIYSQHPPSHPTELVAYALEEPPFFGTESMGSFHHAKRLSESGKPVKMMVCLEMIGFFTDEANSQKYPAKFMESAYPTTGNYIAVVSNMENAGLTRDFKKAMVKHGELPVESVNAPALVTGIDFSDHRNYWKFNIPALMVTDTAFYRNPNYHTANDTPDTLNYQKMAQVIDAVYYSIKDLE
ncbi:M28 family peptidase [Porticoccus sp. W117]|uniref:M28 family peptidase n=1 Tax=Porticoccus sp. W117 TaxID=3054777 RepID=UPI002599E8C3|nr:M28 family peptidase [Porticoccus sp. W117]MDM3871467.1 M28 family peptidase [Porticoccus sp. W117]